MEDLPEPPGVTAGLTREEREDEFLRLIAAGCSIREACAAVALPWSSLYKKRDTEPAFAKRWEDAKRIEVSALIEEAKRRAMKGSDRLIMFMLTNLAPGQFNNRNETVIKTDQDLADAILTARRRASKAPDVDDLL